MTRDSTKIEWKIEYRAAKGKPWKVRPGKFETRQVARSTARWLMVGFFWDASAGDNPSPMLGEGNARVVRHVRGAR